MNEGLESGHGHWQQSPVLTQVSPSALKGIPDLWQILPGGPRKQSTSALPLGSHESSCCELISGRSHSACTRKDFWASHADRETGIKWPHLVLGFLSYFERRWPVSLTAQTHILFPFLWNNTSEYTIKPTLRGFLPPTSHLSTLFYYPVWLYPC